MRGKAASVRAILVAVGIAGEILAGGQAHAADPDPFESWAGSRAPTVLRRGSDVFVREETGAAAPIPEGTVSLNLVEAPVAVAARAVLVDALHWSFTLDERVGGTVTLQTPGPVSRPALLGMFEDALAARGMTLRRRGTTAQILPAGAPPLPEPVRNPAEGRLEPGAQVIPLRWISASEMQGILSAVAPREVVLRADRTRNLLIVSGDKAQIAALRQTIAVFDVDWMRGLSVAMVPVKRANPSAIARDLTEVFGGEAAGTGAMIRFMPNEALGAILVVSSRAIYLDRAREWITRLEDVAAERERQLFVYRIQNRSAKELAAVLQGVVASDPTMGSSNAMGASGYGAQSGYGGVSGTGSDGTAGFGGGGLSAASGFGGAGGGLGGAGSAFGGTSTGPSGGGTGGGGAMGGSGGGPMGAASGTGGWASSGAAGQGAGFGGAAGQGSGYGSGLGGGFADAGSAGGMGYGGADLGGYGGGYGAGGTRRGGIGIVADDTNNSLVISATQAQYEKILRILGRLDARPTQVLLETVIAEVTLNDALQFGVQWFLKNGGSRLNLAQSDTVGAMQSATTGATSGPAALVTAAMRGVLGFNYLLNDADFHVVLNALQGVTRVNVISSPNITVLDNRTAKLQIGDQVPIVKQTGQSALSANAPILNQIELKDTGVILSVTPRVNKNGLVVLDINQEVSDVVPTTTSTINSPTIRQRRVATSVAVSDGHSLAIGGMVQEKAQLENQAVPVLGQLPLIGSAFRNRADTRTRTELIVFLRPKVIRGTGEADRIAGEFRDQFRAMMPVRPVPAPPPLAPVEPGLMGLRQRILD